VNVGNPEEVTVLQLAERIRFLAGSDSPIVFRGRPEDDPERRCPDIRLPQALFGWSPRVTLSEGLERTIAWCRTTWIPELATKA
jgi:dTDP-glucose 4,6-dehydratase